MLTPSATVLLVDDDESVRGFVRRILVEQGYDILEAGDGAQALELAATHPGHIDLLLTDVIMPKINGFALATKLVQERSRMAVLYMSGYMESSMLAAKDSKAVLLHKPFSSTHLVNAVKRSLSPSV
jgi:two-component system cell cycle sensor histidine kinase/response regulator CckA